METIPPQPSAKKNIVLAIGGLIILGAVYYFWKKNKKTDNVNAKTASATDTKTATDIAATDTTPTAPLVSSIVISNANLATSPLIGHFHLTGLIGIINPPVSGTLQVLFGSQEVDSVSLPISGNSYLLDKYVLIDNTDSPQSLIAKLGAVSKTIQIQV